MISLSLVEHLKDYNKAIIRREISTSTSNFKYSSRISKLKKIQPNFSLLIFLKIYTFI